MAAGQRSTDRRSRRGMPGLAGRLVGLNFAFLRAGQDSTEKFGPVQAVVEDRSKKRATKVRVQRLAGDTVKGCVGGKSGHICKALPQALKQGRLESASAGAFAVAVAVAVGSAWQGQPRPTGQGTVAAARAAAPAKAWRVGWLVPSANLPSGAIGDQAGTAGEGQREVAGVPMGLFSQGSTAPFLLAFLASFLSRAYYSLPRFGTSKHQAAFPTAIS